MRPIPPPKRNEGSGVARGPKAPQVVSPTVRGMVTAATAVSLLGAVSLLLLVPAVFFVIPMPDDVDGVTLCLPGVGPLQRFRDGLEGQHEELVFIHERVHAEQCRAFGTSISFTMIASLGVAFTLVPLLAVRLIRGEMPAPGRLMNLLNGGYRKLLDRALGHRWTTAGLAALMFVGGGWLLMELPRELMPEQDNRFIRMGITTPRGLDFEERSAIFEQAETVLLDRLDDFEIETVSAFSRQGFASIFMTLTPFSEGGVKSTAEISDEIQQALPVIPGVEWSQRRGFGGGAGVEIRQQ